MDNRGFVLEESKEVKAPRLAQSPLALECRVFDVIPLGSHDMFLCDILSVAVDESLLDEAGRLCLDRADLVAFAHGEYYALSGVLGKFGFSMADKKKGKGAVIRETAPKSASGSGGEGGKAGDRKSSAKKTAVSHSPKQGHPRGNNGKYTPKKKK